MRPVKMLKRIIIGLLLLVIIAGVILYFTLNGIIRSAVASQATDSLTLKTEVGGASVNLFTGSFGMSDLTIASPAGFQAPHMLSLGQGGIGVSYRRLLNHPVHIDTLVFTRPQLVVEQANGRFNFQVLADLPPRTGEPKKVIIDTLTVTDATVIIRPGIPGLDAAMKEITVAIPAMELKNIGNADGSQNGAAMKEVALTLVTSLVDKAGKSGNLSRQLQDALSQGIRSVETQLKGELEKRLKGIDKNLNDAGLPALGSEINKSLGIGGKETVKDGDKKK